MRDRINDALKLSRADYTEIRIEERETTRVVFRGKDLENAGATWVDEPAFCDGHQVWGRVVADIPAFCRELVAVLITELNKEKYAG